MSGYRYTERDLLETREHYHYSALEGPDFLARWRRARVEALEALPVGLLQPGPVSGREGAAALPDGAPIETDALLSALEARPDASWVDRLVQRFEVTKRLYERYDAALRRGTGDHGDLRRYARLAVLLTHGGGLHRRLPHLNALLKLNDLLLSQPAAHRTRIAAHLRLSIETELLAVGVLAQGREAE